MVVFFSTAHSRGFALASVAALAIVGGCQSSVEVHHQDASDLYHRSYRSYALLEHPVGREQRVDAIIEASIHDRMGAKGYEQKEPSEAELLVSYKVLLSGELAPVSPLHDPPGGGWPTSGTEVPWDVVQRDAEPAPQEVGWRERGPERGPDAVWVAVSDIDVSKVSKSQREKTLLVMLQEAGSYRVVWLSWARTEVTPEDIESSTKRAIDEIMTRVPEVR